MHMQNLVKIYQFVLKVLSENPSIKDVLMESWNDG